MRTLLVLFALLMPASVLAQPPLVKESLVKVYKSPTCGCCGDWVSHLEQNHFKVEAINTDNMQAIKEQAGIPPGKGSCHTAHVDGYVVEGHVPARDIQRLLDEKPDARGLTVPGMPVGSPGMEMGDRKDPYKVLLIKHDGSTEVFSEYP